jgi:hypothetical protein
MGARRVVSLSSAMAMTIALAAAIPAAAVTSTGPLFAVALAGSTPVIDAVDAASGATTEVVNLSGLAPNENFGGPAPDPDSRALYALMEWCNPCGRAGIPYDQIVTVRGSAVSLSPVLATRLGGFAFDPVTRLLWAATNCYSCGSQSLVTVNSATGTETLVATIPITTFGPTDSVAIVADTRTLYLSAGSSKLYALDMRTHTFGPAVSLSPNPIGEIAYDPESQNLVGLTAGSPGQFVRIDPSTGTETTLANFAFNQSAQSLAVDAAHHTVYVVVSYQLGGQFIESVDDVSGTHSAGSPPGDFLGGLAFMGRPDRFVAPAANASPAARSANPAPQPTPGPRQPARWLQSS